MKEEIYYMFSTSVYCLNLSTCITRQIVSYSLLNNGNQTLHKLWLDGLLGNVLTSAVVD